ncbi:MAG: hypothetical protein P8010_14735 [Desulfosarcinaceae bacterium]
MLTRSARTLGAKCIAGITANAAHCKQQVEESLGLATVLCPLLGYETAARLVTEALLNDRSLLDLLKEQELISSDALAQLMTPEHLIPNHPHYIA